MQQLCSGADSWGKPHLHARLPAGGANGRQVALLASYGCMYSDCRCKPYLYCPPFFIFSAGLRLFHHAVSAPSSVSSG